MEFRAAAVLAVTGLLMIAYGSASRFISQLPPYGQYLADGAWAIVSVGVVVALVLGFLRAGQQ